MKRLKLPELQQGTCVEYQGALYTIREPPRIDEGAEVVNVKLRDITTGDATECAMSPEDEVVEIDLEPRWLKARSWEGGFHDFFDVYAAAVDVPEEKIIGEGEWLLDPASIAGLCLALYVDGELVSVGPDGFVELSDFVSDGNGTLVKYTGNDESVVVPEGITIIGDKAFFGFTGKDQVRKIVLPEGVVSIEFESFDNCKNLVEIEMPNTLKRIGVSAFDGQNDGRRCKIKSLAFPASLEEIDDNAFYGCKSLEEVAFSEGLKRIGKDAFFGTSVKKFVLPSSIEKLGQGALDVGYWVSDATVEIVDPAGKLTTKAQLDTSFIRFLPDDEEVCATVLAYQPGKTWMKAVGEKAKEKSRLVLERSIELLADEKKVSAKVGNNLAEFAIANIGALDDPVVIALHDLLEEKKLGKAAERIAAPSGKVVSKPKGQEIEAAAKKEPAPKKQPVVTGSITRNGDAFIDIAVAFDNGGETRFKCETYADGCWLVVGDDGGELDYLNGLEEWAETARERTLHGVDLPVEEWDFADMTSGSAVASFISCNILELPACRFASALESAASETILSFSFEAGFQSDGQRPEAVRVAYDFKSGNMQSKRGYIPVCWGGTDPFEVASSPLGMYARIALGHYPKDNEWQKAPLEWLVIGEEDDSVLLITKDVIDCLPIDSKVHKTTWEDCELRAWLNSDFLDTVFSTEERASLLPNTVRTQHNRTKEYFETTDYAYILSREEAERVFDPISLGEAQPTPVAKSHDVGHRLGSYKNNGRISKKGACWMMRLPASKKTTPACFDPYGEECKGWGSIAEEAHGIRPVVRVQKDSVVLRA